MRLPRQGRPARGGLYRSARMGERLFSYLGAMETAMEAACNRPAGERRRVQKTGFGQKEWRNQATEEENTPPGTKIRIAYRAGEWYSKAIEIKQSAIKTKEKRPARK